ncbi:MAG: hypothetical protein R6V58_17445, partial [Planctomycetota bacterium]
MRWMMIAASVLASITAGAGEAPEAVDLGALPANQWRLLPAKDNGHWGNNIVWAEDRGRLVHWTAFEVMTFDAETGRWVVDYPRPKKLPRVPMGHGYGRTGVTYCGKGVVLKSGVPAPSYTIQAGCYDSKRDRIVFPMRGLMATYDPATKRWGKQESKAVINGRTFQGGPPVFGIGACYDPVNDEIVVFPHYVGTAGPGVPFMNLPKNLDRLGIDGRVSSHLGTLRFSYQDNTWRRVSHTFGSDEIKAARKALFEQLGKLSDALDDAWVIRRRPKMEDAGKIADALGSVAGALKESAGALAPVKSDLTRAADYVAGAAAAARKGDWTAALAAGRDALWAELHRPQLLRPVLRPGAHQPLARRRPVPIRSH